MAPEVLKVMDIRFEGAADELGRKSSFMRGASCLSIRSRRRSLNSGKTSIILAVLR